MSLSATETFSSVRHFDGHIYFTPTTRDQALLLREKIQSELKPKLTYLGSMIDRPIGPHPIPMFEIQFLPDAFTEILLWLMENRNGLNVLVHQVTGNDMKDHYQGALWLGESLVLDDSKLDPSSSG